jgi:predicted ATPase/signal transduction histidine kinase
MTTGRGTTGTSEPTFDEAWLARCTQAVVATANEITVHRLHDPATGTRWLTRSAPWTAAGGCGQLENEVRLAPHLDATWAMVAVAAIRARDRLVVVFPDEEARTLADALAAGPLCVRRFLDVAIGAARATAAAHAQGIVHRDLRPANLLVDGDDRLRLSGFGYATTAGQPPPETPQPALAMPYAAPELTRRDPHAVGPRSDLYSLGVTLYETLTGTLPLQADSAAAWHHAHMAVEPMPPAVRRPQTPELLSQLVLKLLAKDPGARYDSAGALVADLLRSRAAWETDQHIAPFTLGVAGSLPPVNGTGRLFGRTAELKRLSDVLARIAHGGEPELVLLAGVAGAGKSALADHLCRQAVRHGARFAAGKSDQLQRDIPYAPIAQALRSLTMTLLGEDGASLARVRERLVHRLEGQGRAIAEIVPEIEHVIGPTTPLTNVPAQQAQTRVQNAILHACSAFAADGSPLLLFLDDLQWADDSTMSLLRAFTAQPPNNVALIVAYRNQDPAFAQSIQWLVHAHPPAAFHITRIAVGPLTLDDLAQLVGAALGTGSSHLDALVRVLHRKTAGNPFFAYQLLRTLVDDEALRYDGEHGQWQWDAADLAHRQYSNNVVDLMLRRFDRLPVAGREVLRHLACIGLRCDDGLLAHAAGASLPQIRQRLRPYVEAGLLLREPGGYAFSHDRVLEAAYALTPAEERPSAHARIANIMIDSWREQLADHAFEIANQIEQAARHELSALERVSFVRALILAGRRAKNAAAVAQATSYVAAAAELMEPSWWSSHYSLAYEASLLRCECLLAQAELDSAAREIDALLARDMPALDHAAVHRLKATLQTIRSDYEGAIRAAQAGLALLDVHLQRAPSPAQLREAREAVTLALQGRPIATLGALSPAQDRHVQTVMGLLSTLIASFFVKDGISFLHLAKMVELSLRHGSTAESAYGLSWYGVFMAALYGEYEDGLAYAHAALELIDRHGYEAERIATLVALDQVSPWTRPLSYALGHAQHAVARGLASGDLGMASYACNHIVSDLLVMGEQLRLVEDELARGLELMRVIQYEDIHLILDAQHRFVRHLRHGATSATPDRSADVQRPDAAEGARRSNSEPTRFWIWLYDGMTAVYLQEWERAIASLEKATDLKWAAISHINTADCHLYLALASAHAPGALGHAQRAIDALVAHRDRFARWTELNCYTFQSKLLLVEAEIARLRGDPLQALKHYEASANAAGIAGFVHEQALAHEFAGLLCLANDLPTPAREHLRLARACYRRWGADYKVAVFDAEHPFLADSRARESAVIVPGGSQIALDWETGVKAAQALTQEIVLERLIETLMTNMIVHAGAQYGVLVVMRTGAPVIEASGRVVAGKVAVTLGPAAATADAIPLPVLNSVLRTKETLVLADAMLDAPSIHASGACGRRLRSVLCLPLIRGGTLIGVFYLENNLAPGVFDATRTAVLEVLAPQAAISLETARLYAELIDENNRRAEAESGLRIARSELARTSHLTVMGGLAASIAHEVNQPLTAIVTSVDASLRWLNRPTPEIGEAVAGLAHIRHNGLRAAEIIRALRALAKQAPAVLTPLDVDDVVRDVLALTRIEIDAQQVRLRTQLDAGSAMVEADRVQLQQVVLNLVTNALDAMATVPNDSRELVVTSAREQDNVVVRVQDQGTGIAPEALSHIFDPFFTTKSQGMGMGLAICRSIMEAHGGSLEAQSRAEGGSVFVFRLPVRAHP